MGIIENAKEVSDLIKKLGNVELYRRIAQLEEEIIDLSRAKREGDTKIERLHSQLEMRKRLHFKKPLYFADGDNQPYCPKCWEVNQTAIHLDGPRTGSKYEYVCLNCKSWYSRDV